MAVDMEEDSDASSIDLDRTAPSISLPLNTDSSRPVDRRASQSSVADSTNSLDLDEIDAPINSTSAFQPKAPNTRPENQSVETLSGDQSPKRRRPNLTTEATPAIPDTTPIAGSSKQAKKSLRLKAIPQPFLFPPDYSDIDFSDDERIDRLERRPFFTEILPQRIETDVRLPATKGIIPAPIAQWLRDYQIYGATFLHNLFASQRGGILGDDMGLGKTVQVIAFLTAAYGKTADSRDSKRRRKVRNFSQQWYPRTLLVCPGVLIENWKDELRRWGWWDVDVFHGTTRNKEEALLAAKNGHIEIMLTTYTTYTNHCNEINEIEWDCVIADECHIIKSKRAQVTEAMNEVNAKCRIGLTGTAIQNNYGELWTLLNWANPGSLGTSRIWTSTVTEPLKRGQSHDATLMQLGKARKIATGLVQNLLPRFFLRRTKALIADQLPRKFDRVVFCPLTRTQAEAYKAFVTSDLVAFIKRASEICDCGSEENRGNCCYRHPDDMEESWKELIFPAMLMLSKISNHLILAAPNPSHDEDKQERELRLFKTAMPDLWQVYLRRPEMDNFTDLELYGKWKVLRKLLALWENTGAKVLVFSHSTRLLEILQVLFHSTSYTVCYLDGKMSLPARAAEVAKFNTNPDQYIFCISTRAGGVGLNITSANKVVIMDPNWNPAHDLQAQDRAFRIGQRRDVEVYRLVSAGTIEEIIYARQIYKQQQSAIAYTASTERRHFRGLHGGKDAEDRGDIFGLANLFAYSDSLRLKDILDKTDIAETRAGVAIASIKVESAESDNNNDEDSTMSQFAKALSQGRSAEDVEASTGNSEADPVQAILSQAGILYTHDNQDTLGSSRVEAELSAQARQTGADDDQGKQRVFKNVRNKEDEYLWNAPEDVRRRQFKKMAEAYGEDVMAFAVRTTHWSAAQRREFLDDFYQQQQRSRPGTKNVIVKTEDSVGEAT